MDKKAKLKKTLGYYLPNRFLLTLPEITLPLKDSNLAELTIFFHEYSHLLQNIFTVSGWTSFAYEILKYESVIEIARKEREYRVPLFDRIVDSKIKHKIQTSMFYSDYLFENDDSLNDADIVACTETKHLQRRVIEGFPLSDVNKMIRIYSRFIVNGREREVEINYLVLIESMAYLIEQHYGLATIASPDYPYNIIGTIFDQTELKERKDLQIVLIYLSLQSQFPAILFEKIYNAVFEYELLRSEDIPSFYQKIMDALPDDFLETIPNHLARLTRIINQFCDTIELFPKGKDSANWLRACFGDFSRNLKSDPLFYIRPMLMKESPDTITKVLDFNYFLVRDASNKISVSKHSQKQDIFAVTFISNVFHFLDYVIFYEEKEDEDYDPKICPVYNNCSLIDFKCNNCIDKPYLLGTKKINDALCDYGLVAHMFFVHEVPVVSNSP